MKAWELARDLLRNAEPVVLLEEEQTWDASVPMQKLDFERRLFWKSNVPGSGAPENLMVAALQSLENKGYVLPPYQALVEKGLVALDANDMETLHAVDLQLKALMRQGKPDPSHPAQQTVRYGSFAEFDAAVAWPSVSAVDVSSTAYADAIRAGWTAQLVGAAAGTAVEGYTMERLAAVFGPIRHYVRPPNTYNDDITFEIAFIEAFSAKGFAVTSADIAERWVSLIPFAWSAEAIALASLQRGVLPPESGSLDNPFDEWIGAQMRGTICGMVAPGDAREAARLAWLDGQVSHTSNGILGEVFNAVLAAQAFVETDMRKLVEGTVALIAPETDYGAVLHFALAASKSATSWQEAWGVCDAKLVQYNWIHAYPNAAAEIVALWFGQDDFDLTLEIICSIGHDVDCNAAQILCVLAIARGPDIIDRRWTEPLGGEIVTYMRRPAKIALADLVGFTVDAVRQAAKGKSDA